MRTLRASLGSETDELITAARIGYPDLRALERAWAERLIARLRIQMQPIGLEHIAPGEPYVVVALHEGFADVLALLNLGIDLRFAARSELWNWPVLGNYLAAADHLVIDPERPVASMRSMLRWSDSVFDAGDSIAIFAQGTILGIETAMRPGAFEIAMRSRRRVLPVVIAGTHRIWEHPFSPTLRFGCPVHVEVLPPLEVTDPQTDLQSVQRRMKAAALRQLSAQPRRFDPDRDGIWPDYAYSIDPAFGAVAQRVDHLRALAATETSA